MTNQGQTKRTKEPKSKNRPNTHQSYKQNIKLTQKVRISLEKNQICP